MDTAAIQLAHLVLRQDAGVDQVPPECQTQNEYDGRMGTRISAIFVILVGSTLGLLEMLSPEEEKDGLIPSRRHVPNICSAKPVQAGAKLDLLHCEVLWIWGDYCYSLHSSPRTCK